MITHCSSFREQNRDVLGFDVIVAESEESWAEFFKNRRSGAYMGSTPLSKCPTY
jgi:hypothetical protein